MGTLSSAWGGHRVLITGAAGLLGSWTTERFARAGAEVVALDLDELALHHRLAPLMSEGLAIESLPGDILGPRLVDVVEGADTVLHLAAQPLVEVADDDPAATFSVNVEGTWRLLEAVRRSGGDPAVVVCSSDKAYGDAGGVPYVESMPLAATHPYAASKACADQIARTYAATFGMRLAVTRCGNLYGGGDRHFSRLIPGTIRSLLLGQQPVLRSDGRSIRDFLYVEDAAAALDLLAMALHGPEAPAGEAYNVSGREPHTALEVVQAIGKLLGREQEPEIRATAVHEIGAQRVDATKIARALGWEPATPFAEGLERTIEWYRNHLDELDPGDV